MYFGAFSTRCKTMVSSSIDTSLPRRDSHSPRQWQGGQRTTYQIDVHRHRHCPDHRDSNVRVVELFLHAFWLVARYLGYYFASRLPCAFCSSLVPSSGDFFGIQCAPGCLLRTSSRCAGYKGHYLDCNTAKETTYVA